MTIYTEITPNPATLKFVVPQTLLSNGVADYPEAATAQGESKLAMQLFTYPFVKGVFIGRNFVTVTKAEDARWEDVIPVVKADLKAFLESGEKIVEREEQLAETTVGEDEDAVVQKIRQLIDEQVRPAVAMDGGDIVYEGFEDGVVRLKLRGSCSGCPSSIVTLKHGIQNLLTRMVPEVKEVEAVNG